MRKRQVPLAQLRGFICVQARMDPVRHTSQPIGEFQRSGAGVDRIAVGHNQRIDRARVDFRDKRSEWLWIPRNMNRLAVRDRGADVFQLLVHDGRQRLKLRVKLCANRQEGMAAMRAQFIDGAVKPFLFLRAQIRPRKSHYLKRRTYRLGQRGNTLRIARKPHRGDRPCQRRHAFRHMQPTSACVGRDFTAALSPAICVHDLRRPRPEQVAVQADNHIALIKVIVRSTKTCHCGEALKHAILTDTKLIPAAAKRRLAAIIWKIHLVEDRGTQLMSLLVVGSVAFDAVETPHGKVDRMLGGAATYFSVAASFFTHVNLVGVVGEDFTPADEAIFKGRRIDIAGLERAPGKTFFWAGRYGADPNDRVTLATELNVFATFQPRLPEKFRKPSHVFLANIDPTLQYSVLDQISSRPRVVALDTMNYWIERTPAELRKILKRTQRADGQRR